jgi:hypothetical protein
MTILTSSTPREVTFNQWLVDVVPSSEVCNCSLHRGETLRQIDGKLPNGVPVRIMVDHGGYHVAIGHIGPCPDPVTADEVERMLREAQ